ncbi:MAG: hypothetical protein KGL39_33525 [Patescibacteria group bacterium]|nr:hypothetical protein [Patescibacteria group bacterium]
MDDEKKTLDEIQSWLKAEGCTVSLAGLSRWLESARQRRLQSRLLSDIASGARQSQQVERAFSKNPAPEFETLIKLHRVLTLQLSTQGRANPELLPLADQFTKTILAAISAKSKADLESRKLGLQERRVSLLEKKAAAFDAAKKVLTDADLSAEEREQRIKEIYGRA